MSPTPPRHSHNHKHRRSRSRSRSSSSLSLPSLLSHSFPSSTPTRDDLDHLDIIVELLKRDGRRQDKRRARRLRRQQSRSAFSASSQRSGSTSSSSRRSHGRSEEDQSQPSSQRHIHQHHDEQQEESPRSGSGSSSFQRYLRQREEQRLAQTASSSPCPCHERREEEAQQPFWKPATPSDSQSTIVLAGSRDKPIPIFDEDDDDDDDDAGMEKAATPGDPSQGAATTRLESEPGDPEPARKATTPSSSSSRLTRHASPMVLIPAIPSKRRRTKSPSPTPRRRRSSSTQQGKARPSFSLSPAPRRSSPSSSSSAHRPALRERSRVARQRVAKALALDSDDESLLDADSEGSEWGEMAAKAKGKSRAVSSDLSDLSEEDEEAQEGGSSQTSSQRSRGTERPLEDTYLSLASRRDLYCLSLCFDRTTTQTNLLGCILAHVGPTGKYPKVDLRETPDLNGVYHGHEIRLGALMLIAQGRVDEALSTIEVGPGRSEKQMSHLCHNRACIHPGHIVVETRLENDLRNQCKGHTDEVTCTHGPERCLLPYKLQCKELGMELDRDGAFKTVDVEGAPLTRIERPPRLIPIFEPLMEKERQEVELERLRRLAADATPLVKRKRGRPPGTGKRQREEQERLEEARLEGWRLARERDREEEESELVAMRAAAAAAASAAAATTAASARPKKRPILPPERRRNLALQSDWDLD